MCRGRSRLSVGVLGFSCSLVLSRQPRLSSLITYIHTYIHSTYMHGSAASRFPHHARILSLILSLGLSLWRPLAYRHSLWQNFRCMPYHPPGMRATYVRYPSRLSTQLPQRIGGTNATRARQQDARESSWAELHTLAWSVSQPSTPGACVASTIDCGRPRYLSAGE